MIDIVITYPITKQQLRQYRELKLELVNQEERVARLRASLEMCGASILLDEPKSGGGKNKLPDSVAKIIELEEIYREQAAKIYDATVQIEMAIQSLANAAEREVLRLRYVDGLCWIDIQYLMGYERSQAFDIHKRALASIAKVRTFADLFM